MYDGLEAAVLAAPLSPSLFKLFLFLHILLRLIPLAAHASLHIVIALSLMSHLL